MAGDTLEELVVKIKADISQYTKDLKTADDETKSFASKTKNSLNSLIPSWKSVALGAGAAVVAIGALGKKVSEDIINLNNYAKNIGFTIEQMSALKYAADTSNIAFDKVQQGLQYFVRTLGDATTGNLNAARGFVRLGISIESLKNLSSQEALEVVANKIAAIQDPAERASVAVDLFSRNGVQMINILGQGSEGLRQFAQDARDTGSIIDNNMVKSAEEINAAFDRLMVTIGNLSKAFVVALGPAITTVVDTITDAVAGVKSLIGWLDKLVGGSRNVKEAGGSVVDIQERIKASKKWLDDNKDNPWVTASAVRKTKENLKQMEDQLKVLKDPTGATTKGGTHPLSQAETDKVIQGMKDAQEEQTKWENKTITFRQTWQSSMLKMEDALVEFVTTGKLNFKQLMESIQQDIARTMIRNAITKPLTDAAGGVADWLGGMLGSGLKGIFGLAGGGTVGPNEPRMVGERGPELFVPKTAGSIVNNSNLGGGGGNVQVVNRFEIVGDVTSQTKATIMAMMPTIQSQTTGAVYAAIERGGKFSRAVGRKS